MNTIQAICSRKSVRSYTGEPVTDEELACLIKAANAAPVGMKQYESVHLTVIAKPELLAEIDAAAAAMRGEPDIHPLYGAPMLILISAKTPPAEAMKNVTFSNAAIIAQNIALAATELGVGACHIWGATMAASSNPAIVVQFDLPEGFMPCCAMAVGKTEECYTERDVPMDRISRNDVA